jgi:hypothetical protein
MFVAALGLTLFNRESSSGFPQNSLAGSKTRTLPYPNHSAGGEASIFSRIFGGLARPSTEKSCIPQISPKLGAHTEDASEKQSQGVIPWENAPRG